MPEITPENILKIRSEFPILDRKVYGKPLVYLDNTATSQTPRRVVEEVEKMYYYHKANVHRGVHCLSQEATDAMELARETARSFINASSIEEIIFTRGTTEAINLVAASAGSMLLEEGDEVLLTVMEHHSNIVPWQMIAAKTGATVKAVPLLADGSLDMDAFRSMLNPRVKITAFVHISNVLGTVNPIKEMTALAHANGSAVLIDGAQGVAHCKVDVQDIGADFYAFSSHKMYGPSGVGILYGRKEILEKMPPYQGGGEMIGHVSFSGTTWAELPFKFEAGTPDFIDAAAFTKGVEFIRETGIDTIANHEQCLLEYTLDGIRDIPGLRIFGTAPGKCAIISFLLDGAHHYDVGMMLDKAGIAVRTGHHCAQPLMQSLGIEGTVRASFAVYNTFEEADAFIAALHKIASFF